ncbi:MAG: hypothetical protein JXA87_04275 [Thermoleophilia bacterium]|nr:hypothetical protein [Thermoleophilia bacterium]
MRATIAKTTGTTGAADVSPRDVERLFDNGYRDIEILPDGTLRETVRGDKPDTETVTRPIKTERTWY